MKTIRISSLVLLLLFFEQFVLYGQEIHKHELWSKVLSKHVSESGAVNYQGIKAEEDFKTYIRTLKATHPDEHWSREQEMAYWINVYNAFTVALVVEFYPLKSIKDIPSPWDRQFVVLAGKAYSLSQIENEILREKFKDPRIHFAINCASISCPKLSNMAFTAENLEAQLEKLTKSFINNKNQNQISADKLQLSKIFDWYKADFGKKEELIEYLNRYSTVKIEQSAKIFYLNYNWGINH